MDIILPKGLDEWRDASLEFRARLTDLYRVSLEFSNDLQFCKANGLNRPQFSRVMRGIEKPSPKIITALRDHLRSTYEKFEERWLSEWDGDDAREFVKRFWKRAQSRLPGSLYVLSSRPYEADAPELFEGLLAFFNKASENKLVLIFSNTAEDWTQIGGNDRLAWQSGWPLMTSEGLVRYLKTIKAVVDTNGDDWELIKGQVVCLEVDFLDSLANNNIDAVKLSSVQLLAPALIWMLFSPLGGVEPAGALYVKAGYRYHWYTLPEDESNHLADYVHLLEEAPAGLVRDVTERALSYVNLKIEL